MLRPKLVRVQGSRERLLALGKKSWKEQPSSESTKKAGAHTFEVGGGLAGPEKSQSVRAEASAWLGSAKVDRWVDRGNCGGTDAGAEMVSECR